jgi:hypothetical protein
MIVPEQDYLFIADEAGISKDRFTVVGGICLHKSVVEGVYKTLQNYREAFNMKAELKWQKISNQKLAEYQALVDYFLALNSSNKIQFHSIIFDSHEWNHKKYNDGEADYGLSKLYYQLILRKFVCRCAGSGSLYVCLDHRNSKTSLIDLQRMINAAALRDHGHHQPLKQLVSKVSHDDDLLQLNDVILGAVCAVRNGKHLLADTRTSKKTIAACVLEKSGLKSFEQDSHRDIHRFTVWNMRPRPR